MALILFMPDEKCPDRKLTATPQDLERTASACTNFRRDPKQQEQPKEAKRKIFGFPSSINTAPQALGQSHRCAGQPVWPLCCSVRTDTCSAALSSARLKRSARWFDPSSSRINKLLAPPETDRPGAPMRGGCLRQGQRAVDQAALRRTSPQQHRDAIEATEVEQLLLELRVALMPFDQHQLHWALEGWRRCGKGRQPVGLNLGDCFSCGLARALNAPLLFKGTVCTG